MFRFFEKVWSDSPIFRDKKKVTKLEDINNLEDLKNFVKNFKGCDLKNTALNTVFSSGSHNSPLMLIGEAPGEMEDKKGIPFVGRSGQLINKLLEEIGIKREYVYVSNIVFWRPPENRTPTSHEIEICLPITLKHIELVKPKFLVLLGSIAMKAILGVYTPISRVVGELREYQNIPTMVCFHPSYLLRSPNQVSIMRNNLSTIKTFLDRNSIILH